MSQPGIKLELSEQDIRPEELMRENSEYSKQDIANILELQAQFVYVPCPACGIDDSRYAFTKTEFTFVTCTHCETVYTNPRPTSAMLDSYYQNAKHIQHWNEKIFPASEETRRQNIFVPRVQALLSLCREYSIPMNTLMDVGAGFGTLAEEVDKTGCFQQVVAVELAPGLAETCRSRGLEVIEAPIETVELTDINVITSFEVIEHLFCPKDFIVACNQALTPRGLIVLSTPNVRSFEVMTLGEKSGVFGAPNHLNYFHPASLKQLMEQCHFEVLEVTTPGKLDTNIIHKKAVNGELDISNNSFLKHVFIDAWESSHQAFQRFLVDSCLSSHMWIVGRKR